MTGRSEIKKRFSFGKNWKRYVKTVGEKEHLAAKRWLFGAVQDLDVVNSSFLDIGCGSGLFSRAAIDIGFANVVSFDYDIDSVEASIELKQKLSTKDLSWEIKQGSVLDKQFMEGLGKFDFVFSWGVLHHTGDMWRAIENAAEAVKPGGIFFLALYNDQGLISIFWKWVKRFYIASPGWMRVFLIVFFSAYFGIGLFLNDVVRGRSPLSRHKADARGMHFFTDVIDWVGGYPFEVSSPKKVIEFLDTLGFDPVEVRAVGRRHGCNEFIFRSKVIDPV